MPVTVDRVTCREESNEVGSDDVYIVVFRGNTAAPFASNVGVHGPGEHWSNMDSGDVRNQDVNIASFRTDAVYVVMLVEEDNSRDIQGAEVLGAWRSQTALAWQALMFSLHSASNTPLTSPLPEAQRGPASEGIIQALLGLTSIYMEFPFGNDDRLGMPQRLNITSGSTPSLDFNGDGGRYNIRFKVT